MTLMCLTRRSFFVLGAAASVSGLARARSEPDSLLYRARTIVTGQRPETRIPGLQRCLPQALVRVSGDARLAQHPDLAALSSKPDFAVTGWSYRDLYAFRPIRDEQGTRDRPYEMTVQYDPHQIDGLLLKLGSRPWLATRPRIVVFLAVHHISKTYLLGFFGDEGELMRESFQEAAWNSAIEVAIPAADLFERAKLTAENLPEAPLAKLAELLRDRPGQVPLAASLRWNKHLPGWDADWRFTAGEAEHRWSVSAGNFDAAFRNGIGGAAQILSGNGAPA